SSVATEVPPNFITSLVMAAVRPCPCTRGFYAGTGQQARGASQRMRPAVPVLETSGGGKAQGVEPRAQALARLVRGDRGAAATHVGLHPAGVIDAHGDPVTFQILRQI